MQLHSCLNLNQKILKVVGFDWDAKKLKVSQIFFSIPTILVFCLSFVLIYFDPRKPLVTSDIDSQVLHTIYHTRMVLFLSTLIVHMVLSLFCWRSERLKFYEAFNSYDKLIARNRKRVHRKAKKIMWASIAYHLIVIALFTILNGPHGTDFYHLFIDYPREYIFVLGEFFIFLNQEFLNSMIHSLRRQLEITNGIILCRKLKPHEILYKKIKLFQLMNLFNNSFGLLVLFEVFRSFMNLTCSLYVIVAKIVVDGPAIDLLWLFVQQINSFGTNLASCILFQESQKLKKEESLGKYLPFLVALIEKFNSRWML